MNKVAKNDLRIEFKEATFVLFEELRRKSRLHLFKEK